MKGTGIMVRSQSISLPSPSSQSGMPRLVVSAHGGRILSANDACAQLTGYSVEELTALRMGDLLGRQQYPQVMAFLEQSLLAGGGELESIPLCCKNGSFRSVTFTVEIDEGMGLLSGEPAMLSEDPQRSLPSLHCSLKDVSEQERIGQELEERKQALSSLHTLAGTVSQVPQLEHVLGDALRQILNMLSLEMGGVYVIERRDQGGPFVLRAAQGLSPELAASALLLSSKDPLWHQSITSLRDSSHGDSRTSVLIRERISPSSDLLPSYWQEAGICALMALPLEARHRLCGLLLVGTVQPHHFSSRDRDLLELASHQLAMAVDNGLLFQELTDRIRELSAMRQFSASILRTMRDGLLTVDVQGAITSFNPAAEEILQYSSLQVEGQTLASLLGEGSELVALVQESMRGGTSSTRREAVVQRGDGRPVPVGASVALLRARSGESEMGEGSESEQITGAVLVFTDLTEQKRAEDQRRHQDRLILLGEMTAVLAHEVRNPLAGVVHGIQYLVEESSLSDEANEYARLILEDSRRISRLLDDILLISRPQQVELVPCDMPTLLEGVLYQWRARAAARGVEIRTCYAQNAPLPMGDLTRLEEVFVNLLSNALDAMSEGGTLWLRVRPGQLPSSLPGQGPRPAVQVEVQDTGIGIPAHDLQRVFEPFFTTRRRGTGLGLAIARRIVRDHQGTIEVQSEEGKGTRFMVTLPLVEESPGSECQAG
jgi:PAS domain S-box-containing protein